MSCDKDFGYLTLTRGLTWELYGDLWAFTSTEFSEFMAKNGVKHLKTVPYHSVTNGLAEHAVQMLKTAMKKSASEGNIDSRLARFLFHYRTTNSTTVVYCWWEGNLKHTWTSFVQIWFPLCMVDNSPRRWIKSERTFYPNDPVFIKHYLCGPAWLSGEVLTNHRSMQLQDKIVKWHCCVSSCKSDPKTTSRFSKHYWCQ